MCIDMCVDMCVDMCLDMCVDVCDIVIPARYELKLSNTSGELALYQQRKFSTQNAVVWRTGHDEKCAGTSLLFAGECSYGL